MKWRSLKLPECLEKSPKVTKIPKKNFLPKGFYPIVSQEKGLINGYWDEKADAVSVDRPVIIFGDHTQVVKLVNFDFVVGADGVKILKPKQFLAPDYLYYYLLGHPQKELGYARHYRLLKELDVKFPEIAEQKRIVSILDEAFAGIETAIANTEKNLANARELFQSILQVHFDDAYNENQNVYLQEISESIADGDHSPPPKAEEGIPFITIGNIDKNSREIDFTKTFKVSACYFNSLKSKRRPKKGDVLFTVTGSFGIPVLIKEFTDFCFQRHIGLIRPLSKINSRWLFYFLSSPQAQRQAVEKATGTAQRTVSLKALRSFRVPVVSLFQQEVDANKIEAFFENTRQLESIYKKKLTALNEFKQSLLHRAFSGELTTDKLEREAEQVAA